MAGSTTCSVSITPFTVRRMVRDSTRSVRVVGESQNWKPVVAVASPCAGTVIQIASPPEHNTASAPDQPSNTSTESASAFPVFRSVGRRR
ncbi:MAG: hypothetical protein IPK72_04705 [Candidatus Eisenbacteria bacterium]|nr:hypothetical protein [Candidatus Eisenbacteria bacterium]